MSKAKMKALHTKKSPIEKGLSQSFGGQYDAKKNDKLLKKSKAYRIKHF